MEQTVGRWRQAWQDGAPNVTGAAVTVTADPDGAEAVAGPLAHGFAGDLWLGRDQDSDRQAVPRLVHGGRHL
jgi:hypothetical protein